jgi:hypothetical protein
LTIDCAEQLRTNPSVPGQGKPAIPAKVRIRTVVIDVIFMRSAPRTSTVHESNVFIPFGLLLSEKQIPRFIGNVAS